MNRLLQNLILVNFLPRVQLILCKQYLFLEADIVDKTNLSSVISIYKIVLQFISTIFFITGKFKLIIFDFVL